MYLRLIRNQDNRQSVTGELFVITDFPMNLEGELLKNGLRRGYKICDTLENADYLIPELLYTLHVTRSPKFGRLLPIIDRVPGRSGIRMHAGNSAEDSKGCILVGKRQNEKDELFNSRSVEAMLTKLLLSADNTREAICLDITHDEPDYPGYPAIDYSHDYAPEPDPMVYCPASDLE